VQIDQARIAIRERLWLDNLDLALHVIRWRAGGIVAAALPGVALAVLVNFAILHYFFGTRLSEDIEFDAVVWGTLLVMIEAPLATAGVTLYLGQAMFVEQPKKKQIVRDFVACLPQLLLFQLLIRSVLIVPVLTWIVPYALWPFLSEVILLERNPLVGRPGQLSTMQRNSLLHRGGSGDYLARSIGAGLIALALIVALAATKTRLLALLFGYQESWPVALVTFQLVLWTVTVYFTVARFLTYLDQRIKSEGWEVELALRAQRHRLTRQAA
jgi:hypothetical protein